MCADSLPSRPISLTERFNLARRNVDQPAILTFAAAYPSPTDAPSKAFLARRIADLQEHFPQLYARYQGRRTPQPTQVLRAKPWSSERVLGEAVHEHLAEGDDKEMAVLLSAEGQRMSKEDFDNDPIWQVRVYSTPSSSRVYITLSGDHALMDGRGTANLFDALLAKDISQLPYERLETTPRDQDVLPLKPSLLQALPIVWQEIILPLLPSFLARYFIQPKSWPAHLIAESPLTAPSAYSLFSLSSKEVSAIKTISRTHGVSTLSPVFKCIYALAIWSKYHYTLSPFRLSATTARSERKSSLGCSYAFSNYVSSHMVDINFESNASFWSVARNVSHELSTDRSLSDARLRIGMLSYIPSGPYVSPSGEPDPLRPTQYEDFFLRSVSSPTPVSAALAFSNLGLVKLPPGASDLAWAETASSIGSSVFGAAVVGHEGGVRIGTTWKDGTVVRRDEVEDVERIFRVILERLVDGKESVEELVNASGLKQSRG
ncbi:hypothetical protein B9479_002859 [Cryptococcus floricola]|uniref:Alcohol acetyltransferase n=1 Tax=Cryptococcus floricola TaxID=2591691 RepID=A0A5D3B2L9_9TREE|nr:hypothetical protein B9479_002859 [Cryptococcus floricola]